EASAIEYALDLALEAAEKQRFGSKPTRKSRKKAVPTNVVAAQPADRYVPKAVRREVYDRDGGCCTFESADGRRCGEVFGLEIDHIVPFALGGPASAPNLRLLCKTHNRLAARKWFGARFMSRWVRGGPRSR